MRISPHLCYNDPRPLGRQSHNRAVLFLYGRLQGSAMPKEETAGANPQLCGGMSCSMATLLQLVSSYFWQFAPVGSVCVVDYLGIAARCRELAGVICAWQFKDAAVFRDGVLRYISAVVGVEVADHLVIRAVFSEELKIDERDPGVKVCAFA